uniref:Uncharacterized protein n=1 Tax=Meloidogyne enterolobii TaxID=390850 RepID=A0A6V7Y3T2_MELEN|nr:unnamed protein product [Meloidogyne enterolobii]
MDGIIQPNKIESLRIVSDIFINVLRSTSRCPTCGQNSCTFEQKVKFNKI